MPHPLPGEEDTQSALSLRRRDNADWVRSEEHTSELQSPCNLVCRLLLEKKKGTCAASTFCCMLSTRGFGPAAASSSYRVNLTGVAHVLVLLLPSPLRFLPILSHASQPPC